VNSDLLQGFYLRDLLVEPLKGQVTSRAGSVHLQPKAMEVLLCLASSPGILVTRDTLIDDVWGAGHGSQEALSHAVSEIRHALDDHRDNPEFLQTLPKRGYRLIVEADPITANTSTAIRRSKNDSIVGDIGLLEHLKQRGVLETALTYLVLGWLLIQIADIVFDQLHLPQWAGTFVTVLVLAGFPIALALSWFLEFRDGRAVLHTLSPKDALKRRFSRTYISVIGALTIAAVFVFVYDRSIGLPEAQIRVVSPVSQETVLPPILDNTIAVLPFFNLDGSDDTKIFANGLADDVITRLSRIPGLLVSSRGDSFTLDPNSSSPKVRDRLRVALYVEGSVQIAGNRMRIIVQLIDSATGFHVLSRSFDRSLEDFFDIRDEITELTVANVRVALPPETQLLPAADYDESDLNAYILYRTGKEIYEKPRTPDSLAQVIDYYKQALELDPQYAAAHAGLCDVHVALYRHSTSTEDIELAEDACASALASNPRLHMVHTALGELYRRIGRTRDAETAYNEALAINPMDAQAMIGLSEVYKRQQKFSDAEEILHTAIDAQPGNWRTIKELGNFLFSEGRYAEAADAYRQVVFLDPGNFVARGNLGSALTMAGDFDAGKLVYEESLAIQPTQRAYSNLGVIYYYLGEFDKSVATHRKAVAISPGLALMWTNLGDALNIAGQTDESASAFRHAAQISKQRLERDPSDTESIFLLAWSQHMLGNSEDALALVAKVLPESPNDPYGFYYDALIKNQSGDQTGALESLQTALDKGYPAKMLVAEPLLGDLRTNEEFQAMIAESK
jgi:TolB-like protein/Flp pilus assembly protein TadD/DNA-binding winged helix-turn-helix (wHTH) protein